jgi:putative drug exporter of the RND superfamily
MATYLYRLGRFAFRSRRLVLALWLALLAAGIAGAVTLSGPTSNAFSIPGTESQKAIDVVGKEFPQLAANGATARVVFQAPPGRPLDRASVEQTADRLRAAPEVGAVSDPMQAVSADGRTAFAQVSYPVQAAELTDEARDGLTAAGEPARAAGLTVEYGGDAMQPQDEQGVTEVIGVAVAAIVLLITFGSVVAAGLPLLTAIIGIGIGVSAITATSGFVDLGSSTSVLALMIGLAVAIDYALFIVSRYRHELSTGHEPEEAAGRAVGTAGSAVVFAGLTVVIALSALSVVGIPFLTQMGIAAAATVLIAVLIALTLLPALIGFAGRRIAGRRVRDTEALTSNRWVRLVSRRPVAVLLVAVLGLGTLAIPATQLRLGLPDDSTAAPASTQRHAYDLVAGGFGPGFNGPLLIVAQGVHDHAAVTTGLTGTLRRTSDVAAVTPPVINSAGDTALLTVIPRSGPGTEQTKDLVTAIRSIDMGLDLSVTGATAVNIDVSNTLGDAMLPYLMIVVGLAFLLLMVVFRSVLVPLKAALGFLLSVAATFGAVVAVFQWGWLAGLFGIEGQTGPIISMLPIFMIGVVFGLAMDYQVFLVTRMREEYVHGAEPVRAVTSGFAHGSRVVTAAAVIMVSVFAGFILSPETLIRQIGFGLAFAVAMDAFVVRMTIVPAVMTLLGRSAWWLPRWLDRLLPNVDVEGTKLRKRLGPVPREPVTAVGEMRS